MTATYIPVIMDLVDKIISEDRKRKYSNTLIVKILPILQTVGYSNRLSDSSSEIIRVLIMGEIERTFAILEDILGCEFLWYTRHRNYDVTIGMKIVVYNIIILINQIYQRPKRQIMDVVV